jgi:hypothetical protein
MNESLLAKQALLRATLGVLNEHADSHAVSKARRATEVAAALLAFAGATSGSKANADGGYSECRLTRTVNHDLLRLSRNSYARATEMLEPLDAHGITLRHLAKLRHLLRAFNQGPEKRRYAVPVPPTYVLKDKLRQANTLLCKGIETSYGHTPRGSYEHYRATRFAYNKPTRYAEVVRVSVR